MKRSLFVVVVVILLLVGCQRGEREPVSWTWSEYDHVSVAVFSPEPVSHVYPGEDMAILALVNKEWYENHSENRLVSVQTIFVDGTSEVLPLRMRKMIFYWD